MGAEEFLKMSTEERLKYIRKAKVGTIWVNRKTFKEVILIEQDGWYNKLFHSNGRTTETESLHIHYTPTERNWTERGTISQQKDMKIFGNLLNVKEGRA